MRDHDLTPTPDVDRRPAPPPPPPPEVVAGKRKKPAPPPIHPLTVGRVELTLPNGEVLGPVRLVILGATARALSRRSEILWETSIVGWSRTGGSVLLRLSASETASARPLR